jgi:hypothetical protein
VIRAGVLAALVILATSGCSALTGRPLETWAQDRSMTARVKARLASMDAGTLTRIHVDTYENIVYLTGGVTSTDMKRRAEAAARGVPGVEQVVNNLHLAGEGVLASASGEGSASPVPASATDSAVSASPSMEPSRRTPGPRSDNHPILRRFPRLGRVNLETGTPGWTRYSVFDGNGRHVATLYSVAAGELARNGAVKELIADDDINHVSIYRQGTPGQVLYDLVLWHVSREDVAKLE